MKRILIFAGTTEGRKLSECLAEADIAHTICVATEYGEIVLKENPLVEVCQGRMNQREMKGFIQQGKYDVVIDSTHPYADIVTINIKSALEGTDVLYLRLKREESEEKPSERVRYFETNEACAKALETIEGNILLTTGSKELAVYCALEQVKRRLYVRVLPSVESLTLCMEQEICGKQIIAMQGPFSAELNEALLRQYHISCLVTKESGTTGGYCDKIEAAKNVGIPVFAVGRPKDVEGYSFGEICAKLEQVCRKQLKKSRQMNIVLAGIGMGSDKNLTVEVKDAIKDADILLGAQRMIEGWNPKLEKQPYYMVNQIIPYLKELQEESTFIESKKVVILFSGDSGYYSGCQSLYHALQKEITKGGLNASVRVMPGISSVAYLASCIGESYQDAAICSLHGKEIVNLSHIIKSEAKTYLLMSGAEDVNRLGQCLRSANMSECEIILGYQLSYPQQQIRKLTPEECGGITEEGLYICLVKNPNVIYKPLTHGMADECFLRDRVPMTKEEVREVSICKLHLHRNAIVYDIGSGTGSIAIEMAVLSNDIQVYAVEQKKEAVSLIERNKQQFLLDNISVVEAKAPEGLWDLPTPTHAFIGGSGGNLKAILSALYQMNPAMRIVINAICMETICEIREIMSQYPIENVDVVQLQMSRAKQTGQYHLMQAENPVWICAFDFKK